METRLGSDRIVIWKVYYASWSDVHSTVNLLSGIPPPSTPDYIKNNSYYLIDVTHHPTRWGAWNPSPINLNRSWSDEHGLNSLQILSYLLSAYYVTKKTEYLDAWKVSSLPTL